MERLFAVQAAALRTSNKVTPKVFFFTNGAFASVPLVAYISYFATFLARTAIPLMKEAATHLSFPFMPTY